MIRIHALNEENGTEIIQFIGILPLLMIVAMIGWQLLLIAMSLIVALHATRVGVREMAVCGATSGYAENIVYDISPPGFQPKSVRAWPSGDEAIVETVYPVLTISIPHVLKEQLPDIHLTAVMPKEKHCGE